MPEVILSFTDIPPGTYTVKVWHGDLLCHFPQGLVKLGEETKISFELTKK
jgi:hypothetical protein